MAIFLFKNNASSILAASIEDDTTSLLVKAGDGIKFSNPGAGEEFRCMLIDASLNKEIIGVTTRSTDNFTVITRGLEGTAARNWAAGTVVSQRLTAATLDIFQLPVVHEEPVLGANEIPISSDYLAKHIDPAEIADPHDQYLIADHVDETPTEGAVGVPISSAYTFASKRNLLHVIDKKTSGVNGGSFNSGAWVVRALNTLVQNDIPGAIFTGSNIITLPAGKYEFSAAAPVYGVDRNAVRLYNSTALSTLKDGRSNFANSGSEAFVNGQFELTEQTDIVLEHYCQSYQSSNGFGIASSFPGRDEIYSEVLIWSMGDI